MGIFKKKQKPQQTRGVGFWLAGDDDICKVSGYTRLDQNPEIMTACRTIAETIGSMTIHLMSNTSNGDVRITNELSRMIDIYPNSYMTRKNFMEAAVMNLLLYGSGNSVIRPHTKNGLLDELEVIQPSRVTFQGKSKDYRIVIDGIPYGPEEVIHFVMNPRENEPWLGKGVTVNLKDVATNLKQAAATKNAFMGSKYKPSVIVKVDALTEEFASPEGRSKLLKSYIESGQEGEPWLIPAEQFQVEQVRPLTLADLAISDSVIMDKKTVASIIGVPAFLLGAGDYNREEWNGFINTKIRNIVIGLQQELSRKLITSPKMYLRFNSNSLIDWDISQIASVYLTAADRGFISGNEFRDKIHMQPAEGLDEYRVLENYIPTDMSGKQKKLNQEE